MKDEWRLDARSITKYNPVFKDGQGFYKKNEWTGLHQIGQVFDNEQLTFDLYLETEKKYIEASIHFFKFHKTDNIIIRNIEKNDFSEYNFEDKESLLSFYNEIKEGFKISIENLSIVVELCLRNLIWAELFDNKSEETALRFGHDFYMYVNSTRDLNEFFREVEKIGLHVY
jgi:hypothetical protein